MVICPKCNIEYDAGKKFCRKCGSFLLAEEEAPAGLEGWGPIAGVRTKAKLICPKCHALYEIGNYCRRCGSLLVQRIISQGGDVRPLERKSIKKWSSQWLKLSEEKKNLETCLSKLETQRDSVSSSILNPMVSRYRDQLESLSSKISWNLCHLCIRKLKRSLNPSERGHLKKSISWKKSCSPCKKGLRRSNPFIRQVR